MDIWYTENHTDNVRLSIRIDRQLASVQSEFQRLTCLIPWSSDAL